MKKGDNVRLRSDGRYEARYIKGRDVNGKIQYGCCYARTYDEAVEKRKYQIQKMASHRKMNLLILGAGSHGLDVYEIARGLHVFREVAFLDDNKESDTIIGKWKDAKRYLVDYPIAIVAVGDEDTRRKWTEKLVSYGFIIPQLVHPTAFISEGTEIGEGSVICARVTISSGVRIGKGCIVTSGSTVPRKSHIPDWGYFDFDKVTHYYEKYRANENEEIMEDE